MRSAQPGGEFVDKRFHRGVPQAVEAKEIHLFDGLVSSPFLGSNAISGDEDAGAILAKAAVHEDLVPRIVVEEREKLHDLFVGWGRPAIDGDVDKTHAEGFGVLALPFDFFAVFTAQVDDGVDAKDFQLREADFPWLRAAIENFGNFTGVGNAANMQFLAKGGLSEGWRGRLRNILRRSLRKEGERKSEKEGEGWKRAFHIDSDASSVA